MTALRWEWRTFGERFAVAEERFGSTEPERVADTDETYVLTEASIDAVKVRNGLMDVKRLEQVNEEGLELWKPVLKAPMPISAADADVVFACLGISGPANRERYDLADLIEAGNGAAEAIPVHKTRRHFEIDGCMAELTDLGAGGRSMRTIAVEAESAARVTATVRELGLDARPNVSVPKALKAIMTPS